MSNQKYLCVIMFYGYFLWSCQPLIEIGWIEMRAISMICKRVQIWRLKANRQSLFDFAQYVLPYFFSLFNYFLSSKINETIFGTLKLKLNCREIVIQCWSVISVYLFVASEDKLISRSKFKFSRIFRTFMLYITFWTHVNAKHVRSEDSIARYESD